LSRSSRLPFYLILIMNTTGYSFFVFLLTAFISINMYGGHNSPNPTGAADIRFTENKNQWERNVLYKAQLDGGAMFLEKNCFTYNFYDKETLRNAHIGNNENGRITEADRCAFQMIFLNASPTVKVTSKDPAPDYCNYFIGQDERKWASHVKNYKEVNYSNLYPLINLQLLGNQNSVKYNFFVEPYGNAANIKMSYKGLKQIALEKGALKLKTNLNEITEQRPYAYQVLEGEKMEVPCEFVLEGEIVHFNFPKGYNTELELVIDPDLIFACSSGSTADNFGMTATYDNQGNLYAGGTAFDIGYPVRNPIDGTFNGKPSYGMTDVVITKYDASGTFLVYSTYLGGATGAEIVTSLVVDSLGNLLLYGATGSSDFPVTKGAAYDETFNGGILLHFIYNGTFFDKGTDIYVSKFDPTGTSLMASTYIGGSMNDGVNHNNDSVLFSNGPPPIYEFPTDSLQYNYGDQYRGEINVDKFGNVYIASSTRSGDFPVKGFDTKLDGKQDAVVFKLSPDLKTLVWSTYLGGSDNDCGNALTLDKDLNVYVTGGTRSRNFPVRGKPVQGTYKTGKADAFVTKIKADGTDILYSTFWGTNKYDQSYFVQLDQNDNVYILGQTEGKIMVTPGVYSNDSSSQFITKMTPALDSIMFSTVFGNGKSMPNISPSAFLVDYCENIYVSGWGGNILTSAKISNMPITADAFQSTTTGFDFYLLVLSRNAKDLLYGSYFGGKLSKEHVDGGTSRFDKKGIIYQSVCAGCQGNSDFPVTRGSWPHAIIDAKDSTKWNLSSNCNNGTFKMNFKVKGPYTDFSFEQKDSCAPLVVHFNTKSTSKKFLWDFGNNDTTSTKRDFDKTYTIPGTYKVKLYLFNILNCYTWDTIEKSITVHESLKLNFFYKVDPCSREVTFTDSSSSSITSWQWNFGDGTFSSLQNPPKHTFYANKSYDVTLTVKNKYGCIKTVKHPVSFVDHLVKVDADKAICKGSSTDLLAEGGFEYTWSPIVGLNDPSIPNPVASPVIDTKYTVHIKFVNSFGDTCALDTSTTVHVLDPSTIILDAKADKDTLLSGESTIIHAITNPGLSVQWTPTTGVNDPNALDTPVTPLQTTTYTVTTLGSFGCIRTDTVTIYIVSNACNDENVFVPNTFTPNEDGKNDVLYVRSNSLTNIYFAVYNRWGELVFETTDIRKGWDGIYKGMKADPAVFAWYLKATCYNGTKFFKKGNVTLIR
jgi:gliding motility-associated-like protein